MLVRFCPTIDHWQVVNKDFADMKEYRYANILLNEKNVVRLLQFFRSRIFEAYFPIFEYAEHYNHDEFANQACSWKAACFAERGAGASSVGNKVFCLTGSFETRERNSPRNVNAAQVGRGSGQNEDIEVFNLDRDDAYDQSAVFLVSGFH